MLAWDRSWPVQPYNLHTSLLFLPELAGCPITGKDGNASKESNASWDSNASKDSNDSKDSNAIK